MFDNHIHSYFSGDSEMPADLACETAADLGLEGIAITDHLDIDFPGFCEEFMIDFDLYSDFMDNLKSKYEGSFKVLKGIEVGIQPHVIDESYKIIKSYDFDFVIASTHIVDKKDPCSGNYFDGKDKKLSDTMYLDAILHAVENFKNYDVVGHIGYIRRYNKYDDKTLRYADYNHKIDLILNTIINDDKGIEINTSGFRSGLDSPMPDFDILLRYKELGGEIITLGSDAHFAEHIGLYFNEVKDILQNLGFKYLAHFENRKPVFEKII